MNIRIGVHSFSNIADIEMADDRALAAIWNRLLWADQAVALLRDFSVNDPFDNSVAYFEANKLLAQLEPKEAQINADHS